MINYIEKGKSLHEAIEAAGQTLIQVDRIWISSDDTIVQAIIDSHNPLPIEQERAKIRIVAEAEEAVSSLTSRYPRFEIDTFPYQRAEALAFQADSNAVTPIIDKIAERRGKTRTQVASRILAKVAQFEALTSDYVGHRHKLEDDIDSETDWTKLKAMVFNP